MNTNDSLTNKLDRLATQLKSRPSLVSSVLDHIDNLNAEEKFSFASQAPTNHSRHNRCYSLSLVAAILLLVVLSWWGSTDSSFAFAEVQSALQKITTVFGRAHNPNAPYKVERGYLSADHRIIRAELANGLVVVMAPDGRRLMLNPLEKVAFIGPGQAPVEKNRAHHILLDLAEIETSAVREIGSKVIDGTRLQGFIIPSKYHLPTFANRLETRVWVDPATRLPVLFEQISLDSHDIVAQTLEIVIKYEFNVPLADSLFSMTPPVGYRLIKELENFPLPPPALPKDFGPASLVVYPKLGMGTARFGMTINEVVKALGLPDICEVLREYTPEQEEQLGKLRNKLRKQSGNDSQLQKQIQGIIDAGNPEGWSLEYRSLGFDLKGSLKHGFNFIMFYGKSNRPDIFGQFSFLRHNEDYLGGATGFFVGRTEEGITIESTPEDVIKAYGEPTEIQKADQPDSKAKFLIYVDDNDGRMIFCFVEQSFNNVMIIAPKRASKTE